jgi:HAE1 family hydrophobic/amphiphilic exporter-1/multidrug efflux pump
MRVPGFGSSANSFNSFIIIALLEDWKKREKDAMTIMRQAIGKIVTCASNFSISNFTSVHKSI